MEDAAAAGSEESLPAGGEEGGGGGGGMRGGGGPEVNSRMGFNADFKGDFLQSHSFFSWWQHKIVYFYVKL